MKAAWAAMSMAVTMMTSIWQHVSVDCRDDDPADQWTSERDERVLINDEDLVLGRVMTLL